MTVTWFIFAHPDDEFAVTRLLKDCSAAGERVDCVYLTDCPVAGTTPPIRHLETQRVLQRMGVRPECVHFTGEACGFPDGFLCRHLDNALEALVSLAAETGTPNKIFCPAWEGGHQDHDAVHLLALALAKRLGKGIKLDQFPLYHGNGLTGSFFRILSPLAANGPIKIRRSAFADRLDQLRTGWSYPSQWRTWIGLFPFLAWHVLTDGRFQTQSANPSRVLEPPHSGQTLYERRGFMSYKMFRNQSDPFIRARIHEAID